MGALYIQDSEFGFWRSVVYRRGRACLLEARLWVLGVTIRIAQWAHSGLEFLFGKGRSEAETHNRGFFWGAPPRPP